MTDPSKLAMPPEAAVDSAAKPRAHPFLLGFASISLLLGVALWAYRSRSPVILDRYSASYAGLLAAHAAFTLTAGVLGWSPTLRRGLGIERVETVVGKLVAYPILLASVLVALWVGLAAALLAISDGYFGHSWNLHVSGALAVLWSSLWLIFRARSGSRVRAAAVAKLLICSLTAAGILLTLEMVLRANPGLLSDAVIQSLPEKGDVFFNIFQFDDEITVGYRYRPGVQFSQALTLSATHEYETFKGVVAPLDPKQDRILCQASFRSDSMGYRNSEPLGEIYPIVVSGDSFTSHSIEPRPWPTVLSERLAQPVLNLGLQGYGPQSEVEAILRFGLPRQPRQIVLGFYEGNDILDAEGYERRKRLGQGWRDGARAKLPIIDRYLCAHVTRHVVNKIFGSTVDTSSVEAPQAFPYPFSAKLSDQEVSLGFADTYLSFLSLPRAEIERLSGFGAAMKTLERLRLACAEKNVRLLVAYFPTKEHCYIPLLPADLVASKLGKALEPEISATGEFVMSRSRPRPLAAASLLGNIDSQRQLVLEALRARGIEVIDLTPRLQEAARKGAQLYWSLDNHWTPAGHELAAKVIGEALVESR